MAKILRVGTTFDYPPFTFIDHSTSKPSGIDINIISQIAAILKFEIEWITTTWWNLSNDLINDKFDIALGGITNTLERNSQFLISHPLIKDYKTILINKDYLGKITDLKSLDQTNNKIVVNIGGTNEMIVKQYIKSATIIEFEHNLEIFEYLISGNADAMITDSIEAIYRQMNNPQLHSLHSTIKLGDEFEYVYLFQTSQLEIYQLINSTLNNLITNNKIKLIIDSFLNTRG